MLYRSDSAELRAKARRLLELADRRQGLPEQRTLMAQLGGSRRMAAIRPLTRAWACSAQVGRPKKRWFSSWVGASDEASETADQALLALQELWSMLAPSQYHQLDQELRAGGYGSRIAEGAWWQLSPQAALDAPPASGELRTVGLGVLSSHPSGHVREAALRGLTGAQLGPSLPFFLVRANDWVRQVRAVAYARLLALDESDVEELAERLELVQRLASQRRREPGAVDHLLNLLRTPRGLAAIQDRWTSPAPSLRRASIRFSWDESPDRRPVLRAAVDSHDAVVRRWAVDVLSTSDDPSRAETLRLLARDTTPMVATAALDALDPCIEPHDLHLLKELRSAPSPGLQDTARFMLKKHFGEESHRDVYLGLLASADERSRLAAAIGLAATGEPEDHRVLLSTRLGARSKLRQQLLRAAAGLDPAGARGALFEDLGHELPGVSKGARKLLAERLLDAEAGAVAVLLDSSLPHVRRNALILAARLSHWPALPLILRGTRDPDGEVAESAHQLLEKWLARHHRGIYPAPDPSQAQKHEARAEMVACAGTLGPSTTERLGRALAGEWAP